MLRIVGDEQNRLAFSFPLWLFPEQKDAQMKHIATVTLLLNLGVAGLYAHEKSVKMTFSGTEGASAIDLQFPNTRTAEFNFAGHGTLGRFTFRNVEADEALPQQSSACPANQVYVQITAGAGAGVFRFQDESLLTVKLTEGFDCIDLAVLEAHCTRIFHITGGTGRFKDASGILKLTETTLPVADALDNPNNPVFFAATGEFVGTISGVAADEERQDERR